MQHRGRKKGAIIKNFFVFLQRLLACTNMMKPQPCYSIRAHSISRGILMSFKGALPINSLKPGTKQQGWEEWASPPLLMDWATTPTCQNQSKGLPSTAQTMAIGLDRASQWQMPWLHPLLGGGGVKDASLSLQNGSHKALKWSISSSRAPGPTWGHSSGKTGDRPPVWLAHSGENRGFLKDHTCTTD